MNTDTALHLLQLVLAVGMGLLALSSTFSLVLGARHHRTASRARDLRLAGYDAVAFTSIAVALAASPNLTTGIVWTVPGQVALAIAIFSLNSVAAEKRIALSVHEVRGRGALA